MRYCVYSLAWFITATYAGAGTLHSQTVDVAKSEAVTVEIEGERPAPPKSPDVDATVQAIVERSNGFRKQEGRSELAVDQTLQKTAQDFADYMAEQDRYGHQADGRTPSERAKAQGYDFAIVLENIAYAYDSRGFEAPALAEKLVQGWIESPEHRENLLDPDVTQIGVGVAESPTTHYLYAVQLFARPASLAVEFTLFNATQAPFTYKLDERSFVIEPRYARTHRSGRPPTVTIEWPDESEKKPTTFEPESGMRYVIQRNAEGAFELAKTKAEKLAPAASSSSDPESPRE